VKTNVRHRVSVVVVDGDHLLGFRAEDPHSKRGYFFIPGGKIENDESALSAAVRETLEETGYSIEVSSIPAIERIYDFEWDGQLHECHTLFVCGRLLNKQPRTVQDAAYHQGVVWLPLAEIDSVLAYHKDILEPVQLLLAQLKK
jgi:tRNA(adenine34) deaminase